MIFLESILFNRAVEFETTRQSHLKKKLRKEKVVSSSNSRYERRVYKGYLKYFEVIPKGFEIKFNKDISVIVGDNGCGKTTLLKELVLPNFLNCRTQEQVIEIFKSYAYNDLRILSFVRNPSGVILLNELHKSAIRKDIGDKLDYEFYTGRGEVKDMASHLMSSDDSNGEVVIDILFNMKFDKSRIILDEPETSLSLKSVKKLIEKIKELAKTNQIIISTHHPYLIEMAEEVFDMEAGCYKNAKQYLESIK